METGIKICPYCETKVETWFDHEFDKTRFSAKCKCGPQAIMANTTYRKTGDLAIKESFSEKEFIEAVKPMLNHWFEKLDWMGPEQRKRFEERSKLDILNKGKIMDVKKIIKKLDEIGLVETENYEGLFRIRIDNLEELIKTVVKLGCEDLRVSGDVKRGDSVEIISKHDNFQLSKNRFWVIMEPERINK